LTFKIIKKKDPLSLEYKVNKIDKLWIPVYAIVT